MLRSDHRGDPPRLREHLHPALAAAWRAFELFEAEHVLYMPQFMFGGPGETLATIEETVRFMRRFKPVMMQGSLGGRVYPLAPLRARAIADGLVAPDDDLLDPCFYVAPGLQADEVARRLMTFRPRRLPAAGQWCRYLWRLSV